MTTPALVLGSGQTFAPEALLRQELLLGLLALAADTRRATELFARVDELHQGSHDSTPAEWVARLREMVNYGAEGSVRVRIGYPRSEMEIPCVSIIEQSGNEIDATATFNDLLAHRYEVIGTPDADDWSASTTYRHDVRGTQWQVAVQLGTWAATPEDSLILASAVKAAVFDAKGRLQAAGVEEITLSEGGVEVSAEIAPLVGYVPILTVRMDYTRKQTRRRQVPTRVRLTVEFGST